MWPAADNIPAQVRYYISYSCWKVEVEIQLFLYQYFMLVILPKMITSNTFYTVQYETIFHIAQQW